MSKGENNLIAWIASRYPTPPDDVLVGIGDDMAMLRTNPAGLLVTADMLMDGVHFETARHTPAQIGRKAIAVSLSDCAAMAVRPRYAVVSVALPTAWTMEQAQAMFLGMERIATKYGCAIVGGDTNSWAKPLVIDVCVMAEPWRGVEPIRRDGLRAGDAVFVTGTLGGSLREHHLTFIPRVSEARRLAEHLGEDLHAMMDLSDGLSTDAPRMAKASHCGIEFDEAALRNVASKAAIEASREDGRPAVDHVLNDGEDFELLFGVAPDAAECVLTQPPASGNSGDSGLVCTCVGTAVEEAGVWLKRADGSRSAIRPAGWEHFIE